MDQCHSYLSVDGLVRGRGRLVGGRLGLVRSRGGLVGGRGLGVSLVLDIGNIARVGVTDGVLDNLGAAVGEEDGVSAVGGVSVTGLGGIESEVGVLVLDGVAVLVVDRGVLIDGGGGVGRGSGGAGGGGHDGDEGKEGLGIGEKSVKVDIKQL